MSDSRKAQMTTSEEVTRPWGEAELMTVDGLQVVYSGTTVSGLTVHQHGGAAVQLMELLAKGHQVTMPKKIRLEEATQ